MEYIAGVDIGNSSTEVALVRRDDEGTVTFVAASLSRTTGLKGTEKNVPGVVRALERAAEEADIEARDVDRVLLNEAAPVIGDVAMETITETVITESTMIGHDPSTPGGEGLGMGTTVDVTADMDDYDPGESLVFLVPGEVDFAVAAERINEWADAGVEVAGAVVQNDDAVLIDNRIDADVPIVDEVSRLEAIPRGQPAAVEVAPSRTGRTIDELSNPYGIATAFDLSPEETRKVIPVARALVGNKSAVVVKTPKGDVEERTIPAGDLRIVDERGNTVEVPVDEGAGRIMDAVMRSWPVSDVRGESGSNIGGMLNRARDSMAEVTGQAVEDIEIRDVMAVDTLVPQNVQGSVADEYSMENAVGLAAMVKTQRLPMRQIADGVGAELGCEVLIQGVEANMAVLGSLTTPGTDRPVAILDMGGGSTDAAYMGEDLAIDSIHLSGAGDMVTMLIDSELGLDDRDQAEAIKKFPAAKVETLFSIRQEDGTVTFFDEAVDPELFGRTVLIEDEGGLRPVTADASVEEIRRTRREAKRKVFVTNAERALNLVTPTDSIRHLPFVVMVGRSALDFEIPELVSDALAEYGIVCGRANVRGEMGPRNAVATGLVLSHVGDGGYLDFALPEELTASLDRAAAGDD
ncbi:diol dehydratase reactivase subunit alpha [Halomarina litorea]|uniref:diol dehydratase reactivase subunit alpha n=1 Tax=Halomarina litorea TaxID=2961595 RepID=UPI0020C5508E|nr:diol dehydratase reactivase subunit alpha [Halomarina sp. BCD28]